MKYLSNIYCIASLVLVLASCRKDEKLNVQQPVGLGGDITTQNQIDKWILDSLTTPYNIAVKYRWDPANATIVRPVTPVDERKVLPLFSAMRRLWIKPYDDETGSLLFMKKYTPKEIILLGSVDYVTSSLARLGEVEGGNNIVIYDVNQNNDKDPIVSIRRVIQTAHHEFGHFLHGQVRYPQDFIGTSSKAGLAGYTGTWFNVSHEEALANGYATNYSMSGADDDWVEMIAIMLTEGKTKWEDTKASVNAVARQTLQQKENYVVTYYRQVWNIDFYRLQARIQAGINALFPSPLTDYYGFGKSYTTVSINPANTTLTQQSGFTNAFNAAKTGLASYGTLKPVLDSVAMITSAASSNTVRMYSHSDSSNYLSDYTYNFNRDANGVYTFTYAGVPGTVAGSNATVTKANVQPLLDYFGNNTFKIDWYANPNSTIAPLKVVFTPQTTANAASMGLLLP